MNNQQQPVSNLDESKNSQLDQKNDFFVIRINGDSCSKGCNEFLLSLQRQLTLENIIILIITFGMAWGIFAHVLQLVGFAIFTSFLAVYELIPKKFSHQLKSQFSSYLLNAIVFFSFSFIGNSDNDYRYAMQGAAGSSLGFIAFITFVKTILKQIKQIAKQSKTEEEFTNAYQAFKNTHWYYNDYFLILFLITIILLWIIGLYAKLTLFLFFLYTLMIMAIYNGIKIRNIFSSIFKTKKMLQIAFFLMAGLALSIHSGYYKSYDEFSKNIELPLAGMLEACALGLYLFKQEKNNSEIKEQLIVNQQVEISFKQQFEATNIVKEIGNDEDQQKPIEQK